MLGEGQEPAIVREITLPELLELASMSTNCTAVIDGWRGNQKVGQIKLEYTEDYNSFTMTFVAKSDFTSLHVLSLISDTWVVVIRSATDYRVVLIDSTTHQVIGGDPEERLDVVIFPARQVQSGLEGIRDGLDALKDGPQVVFSDESADAKRRCQNNRRAGWVKAIGTAVGLVVTVGTGGSALVAIAAFAAAGAVGGAMAAETDNDATKCMKKAEAEAEEEEEVEEEEDTE